MKKVTDILRPNLLIIFGAILLLYFLNWLSHGRAGDVAVGGYAIAVSGAFIAVGVLGIVLGDKLNQMTKNIFDVACVSLFGTFMFVYFLTRTIDWSSVMGPTGWIIKILSMVASLALIGLYVPSKFAKQPALVRFAYLFSAIFCLALLLDILFLNSGEANALGGVDIILLVAYGLFATYLFNSFAKEEAPKQVEAKEE